MAKKIEFLEILKDEFELKRDVVNQFLADKKLINIETLLHSLKFWFFNEN